MVNDMVHTIEMKKYKGIIVETDEGVLLLTRHEYLRGKNRFDKRFLDSDMRKRINGVSR